MKQYKWRHFYDWEFGRNAFRGRFTSKQNMLCEFLHFNHHYDRLATVAANKGIGNNDEFLLSGFVFSVIDAIGHDRQITEKCLKIAINEIKVKCDLIRKSLDSLRYPIYGKSQTTGEVK